MIEQCVSKKCKQQGDGTPRVARQFLLMWSCVGTRVIRDMTLHSAPSFGSFHLLHLMFDEYVLYMVENIHNHDKANDLLRAVKGEIAMDFLDELLLSVQYPCKSSILTDSMDTQRTTVIRGPELPYQNGEIEESSGYYSQNESVCFQQPVMCTSQRMICSSGQSLNQPPPFENAFPTTCRHRTNSFYGIYSSQVPDVVSSNNTAVNSYACNDWSTTGQMGSSGLTNMAGSKTFSDKNNSLNPGNAMEIQTVQLQAEPRQNTSHYYGGFCGDQTSFKRCSNGHHSFSKKCSEDIPNRTVRPNMSDMYYHHVTNLL
ncbi:transcription factor RFX4-like [Mercenaria mercenaria]|uniref:transcription factor RFX4-like n=1 Tax=Mercenaria mercenaria TaxID=6596 RepID=UPI00234E923A|nr:transcription factor RFX4-like [Mercenaria mercenaria]